MPGTASGFVRLFVVDTQLQVWFDYALKLQFSVQLIVSSEI